MPATATPEKITTSGLQKPVKLSPSSKAFWAALVIFAFLNGVLFLAIPRESRDIRSSFSQSDLHGDLSKLKKPWSWWLARAYLAEDTAPEIVVFGSSQMGSAQATADASFSGKWVDVLVHRHINYLEHCLKENLGKPTQVSSLAIPGAMVSDCYLITRSLFVAGHTPHMVIATVAPRDFIDNTLPSASATDQFHFFSKYADCGPLEKDAYTDPIARLDVLCSRLPMKTLGQYLHTRYLKSTEAKEETQYTRKGREVANSISSTDADVGPEQWVVPPKIDVPWADNTPEYKNRFKGPNMENYRHQMNFLHGWLKDLHNSGTKVLLVGMPSLEMNRKLLPDSFWNTFRTDLAQTSREYGATWYDLTDSKDFTQSDYLDTVHLNGIGGRKLFEKIAAKVAAAKLASAGLDHICPD